MDIQKERTERELNKPQPSATKWLDKIYHESCHKCHPCLWMFAVIVQDNKQCLNWPILPHVESTLASKDSDTWKYIIDINYCLHSEKEKWMHFERLNLAVGGGVMEMETGKKESTAKASTCMKGDIVVVQALQWITAVKSSSSIEGFWFKSSLSLSEWSFAWFSWFFLSFGTPVFQILMHVLGLL